MSPAVLLQKLTMQINSTSQGVLFKKKTKFPFILMFYLSTVKKLSACMKYHSRAIHKLQKVAHATYLAPESSQTSTCCPVLLSLQPS